MEITESVKNSLQIAMNRAHADSPRVSKRVLIERGKYQGKEGAVTWHGLDKYANVTRYEGNWMQSAMREALGRIGYRIRVKTDSGEEFFTSAEYATVVDH